MLTTIAIIGLLMVLIPYLIFKYDVGCNKGAGNSEGSLGAAFLAIGLFLAGCILIGISAIFWIFQHINISFS